MRDGVVGLELSGAPSNVSSPFPLAVEPSRSLIDATECSSPPVCVPKSSSLSSSSSCSQSSSSGRLMTPDAGSKLSRWLSGADDRRSSCHGLPLVPASAEALGARTEPEPDAVVSPRMYSLWGLLRDTLGRLRKVRTTACPLEESFDNRGEPRWSLFDSVCPFFSGSHGCGRTPLSAGCP